MALGRHDPGLVVTVLFAGGLCILAPHGLEFGFCFLFMERREASC